MNYCKYCKYYGEYNEFKFQPTPICKRHQDLKTAIEAIENSDSCKLKKKIIKRKLSSCRNSLHELSVALKKSCKNFEKSIKSTEKFRRAVEVKKMFKIKDNVDFKELEKYGYEYKYGEYEKRFKNGKYIIDIPTIFSISRRIIFHKKKGTFYIITKPRKRLIKDLIKAGLVEKA